MIEKIQLIIEVPKTYYERCKDYVQADDADYHHEIIANGTPLPSTKGNSFIALCNTECVLTDKIISCLKDSYFVGRKEYCNYCFQIAAIIEADRGEEE